MLTLYKSGNDFDLPPSGTYQEVSLDGHAIKNPRQANITAGTRLPAPRDPNHRWVVVTKPAPQHIR